MTPRLVHRRRIPTIESAREASFWLARFDLLPACPRQADALCAAVARGDQVLVLPEVERALDTPDSLDIVRLADLG